MTVTGRTSRRALLRTALLALALVPAPSACDTLTGVCTNVGGCMDGLRVQLEQLPVGDFTVTITTADPIELIPEAPDFRYTCTALNGPCLQEIFFGGYLSRTVYVEVTTALGTEVHHRPGIFYKGQYPNGRGCGGACRTGEVSVPIPE